MLLISVRLDIHLKMIESAPTACLVTVTLLNNGPSNHAHNARKTAHSITRFASVRCPILSVGIECERMGE